MEQAILRELEGRVLVYATALRQAADVAAEIDWYESIHCWMLTVLNFHGPSLRVLGFHYYPKEEVFILNY